MQSQKRLRDELRFVTEFNALFDVMQQVAVSQLRRTDERAALHPGISDLLLRDVIATLPARSRRHPLVTGGGGARLIVAVTSDEGFVGPLHANVIRQAASRAEEARAAAWVFVGQRGVKLLGDGAASSEVMAVPPDDEADAEMRRLAAYLIDRYTGDSLQDVWLAAPRFVSASHQEVIVRQLLPLPVGGASAAKEAWRALEPSLDRVLQELAQCWVEAVCVETFWSARRAELAARALHVESSRQELARHAKAIRHEFFKTLHERADVLVRETCVVRRRAGQRPPGIGGGAA